MKAIRTGVLCAAVMALGAGTVLGQAFPAKITLTRLTTNGNAFVKTTITEKDIVAACALEHGVQASQLKLMFLGDGLAVVDTVTTNMTCLVATISGEYPTNVMLFVQGTKNTNQVKVVGLMPFKGLGGSSLVPADFGGSVVLTFSGALGGDVTSNLVMKGTIQGGSTTNGGAVYTGTMSVGGKAYGIGN